MSFRNHFFKIILLGDMGVGKTALLDRYVNKRFSGHYKNTIGIDFLTKALEMEGRFITLQIWDTAGQERFLSLSQHYFRGADFCFLVIDVTNPKSFKNLEIWYQEFIKHAGTEDSSSIPFFVLANKIDVDEEVDLKEVENWCESHNDILLFRTSAKTAENVEQAFTTALQFVLKQQRHSKIVESPLIPAAEFNVNLSLTEEKTQTKGIRCCGD
eukprot:TRINITY_DN2089_c0_g1_i1.p1 TRINITY_DN2089_c0_g1~~TRINITY_DN2089_c0_g1_i1.p1  ORF type:complete len:213 (-),score=30.25 TRINITY_DN2089_c0_g1_i1:135-773(-)